VGQLIVAVHESGALPVWREFQVVEEAIYDALFGASATGLLPANVTQIEGADATDTLAALDDAVLAAVATVDDFLDTEIAAIKAKTDNLPSDPADASVIAGRFDTLDTAVADLPTNAELASSQAAADDATLAAIAALSIPTAGAIADQVWDEAISGHAGAGSTGEALSNAGAAGTPPTASEVATEVWDRAISGHLDAGSTGEALNAASSGSAAGPGAISWDVLVQVGVTPQQAAAVWVSTDAGGSNVVAGTLITPSNGTVTFLLDAGTYYAFVRKDGLNPVNGQSFVVS
jgi:hypothetical protein